MVTLTTHRHTVYYKLPTWARGSRLVRPVYAFIAIFDALHLMLVAAVKYRFPMAYGNETLGILSLERGMRRYPRETDQEFAARLNDWWEQGRMAGSFERLARELQRYTWPAMQTVRIIQNNGRRFTLSVGGVWSWDDDLVGTWNWDGNTAACSRFWVLLTRSQIGLPVFGTTVRMDQVRANMNGNRLIGSNSVAVGNDARAASTVVEVVEQYRAPYTFCDAVLVLTDEDRFWAESPSYPTRDYTFWGNRSHGARYWKGTT